MAEQITSWDDIISPRRDAKTVKARNQIVYNLYMSGEKNYREIGELLGGRTPATIHHAFVEACRMDGNLNPLLYDFRRATLRAWHSKANLLSAMIDLARWQKLLSEGE